MVEATSAGAVMGWFGKDKPCKQMGHWWGPEFIYKVDKLRNDGYEVREIYLTRDCQRCGVRDKSFIDAEVLGVLRLEAKCDTKSNS
jgi:hypothetical protein